MKNKMFINAEWVDSSNGETFGVVNPANEEIIASVPRGTREDGKKALEAAEAAQLGWGETPPIERARFLYRIAELISSNREELARLLTLEQGKPLFESLGEIDGTAEHFRYFAEDARRIFGDIVPSDYRERTIMITRQPHGVVVGITPWNFPAAMVARKIAPAIVTGNTIVLKPSSDTPLIALRIAELIQQSGLPPGVVNVVTGSGADIGDELVRNKVTKMITMTGSTLAGARIMETASKNLTKVLLELGGNAPFIVWEDADLDWAVKNAVWARFWNGGQTCICAERFYIHEAVSEEFLSKFAAQVKSMRMGNGLDNVEIGPRINKREQERVDIIVQQAISDGANLVTGGKTPAGGVFDVGYWYEPTILTGVTEDMGVVKDETFGPVAPVIQISDFDEAIMAANSSDFGLAAYLFTRNLNLAHRGIEKIRFGEIYVNQVGPEALQGYHTGFRCTGLGGEGSKYGLEEYLQKKTIYIDYSENPTCDYLMPYE